MNARALVGVVGALSLAASASAQLASVPAYYGEQPELVPAAQPGLATAKPKLRHVYMATPDTLAIVIDDQAIVYPPVIAYVPRPGDRIVGGAISKVGPDGREVARKRALIRDGVQIGSIVGPSGNLHVWPALRLVGEPLDLAWASAPATYTIIGDDDPAYRGGVRPMAVFRKSKPQAQDWVIDARGQYQVASTDRHELYLRLPRPLTPGKSYRLRLDGASPLGPELAFTFDDHRLRTEAIEVNQNGYDPVAPVKTARLAMWLGSGGDGDLSAVRQFRVIDEASGATAFTGAPRLLVAAVPGKTIPAPDQAAGERDPGRLPMTVRTLDFSALTRPGRYRLCADGLGCSFPFAIGADVWTLATKVSAQGYLNQRSGIALGPPYTKWTLPRVLNPADGFVVHETDPARFFDKARFSGPGLQVFARIQASLLWNTQVPQAWGGWNDAADYDRDIAPQNHVRAVHAMLDLYASNPAFFDRLNLNIPESGNAIPDLLDEALWCMELFRRLQHADGGVPSSVESIEHPVEPSPILSQPTAVTPPMPQSNFMYAAAAAQLAVELRRHDAAKAAAYRASAERAMAWADANRDVPNVYARAEWGPVDEQDALASVWLYRLTGDGKWHDRFKAALHRLYPDGALDLGRQTSAEGPWSLAGYALLPADLADPALQAKARRAILAAADARVREVDESPYGIPARPASWGDRLGNPWILVIAHRLTGAPRYVRALERMAQYALGANPVNASFTTGLGTRPITIFNLNAYFTGQPFPEGLTGYGPLQRSLARPGTEAGLAPKIYPSWGAWPWAESHFDPRVADFTEYVVGGVMANQLLQRGYLAQYYALLKR